MTILEIGTHAGPICHGASFMFTVAYSNTVVACVITTVQRSRQNLGHELVRKGLKTKLFSSNFKSVKVIKFTKKIVKQRALQLQTLPNCLKHEKILIFAKL